MSKYPPDREQSQAEKVEIFFELPPSPQGMYQYQRADVTVVHGDASGEWTLDEHGVSTNSRRGPLLRQLIQRGHIGSKGRRRF